MHFPTWIDLKGQDSVPETVHHVVSLNSSLMELKTVERAEMAEVLLMSQVLPVDPRRDTSWKDLKRHIKTDEVHANDHLNYGVETAGGSLDAHNHSISVPNALLSPFLYEVLWNPVKWRTSGSKVTKRPRPMSRGLQRCAIIDYY